METKLASITLNNETVKTCNLLQTELDAHKRYRNILKLEKKIENYTSLIEKISNEEPNNINTISLLQYELDGCERELKEYTNPIALSDINNKIDNIIKYIKTINEIKQKSEEHIIALSVFNQVLSDHIKKKKQLTSSIS